MRKNTLMSVSAIALIASAGVALAQDKGGMGGGAAQAPQSTSPAQQSAPSAQPGGGERGGTTGQGEPRGGAETKGGQTEQRMDQKGDRSQRSQEQRQNDQKGAQDQQMNQRENRAQDKSDKKGAADTKSQKDSTTGQGAAGSGGASLTTEQRTKISTTIKQTNVRPATNVNFNVSVGTVVPRSVTLHALPATVVEVYPEWRSYRFLLVGDEIIIIEPDTFRIVAVIDA